jgi:pSer/pThr/pTyr-binding forkhead associated (FHA) protein
MVKTTLFRRVVSGLVLYDPLVSHTHARLIYARDGRWYLIDLKSAKGLWVNGQRVASRALTCGDQILMGQTAMLFRI